LSNDILPVPEAMFVTGIGPVELAEKGVSEREFISRIADEFSRPGTCVVGYNNLRFDDEFTRHTLYRNLLDPYAREWQGGNSRWDVIDLVRMCYALRPDGIEWPQRADGLPVFKLEELTSANGISHEDAHDALSDVRATIELSRLIKHKQPKLYDFLFQLRNKKKVLQQLYPLGKAPVVHVSAMYSAERNCTAVVLPLTAHPENSNGVICYDLSADPQLLVGMTMEEIRHRVFTRVDQLPDGYQRIPLKIIHINRCPAVAPLNTLSEVNCKRLNIDLDQCKENMRILQNASGVTEKIQDAFNSADFPVHEDPDLMLYSGGFFSTADRQLMNQIVALDSVKLKELQPHFQDNRLEEMLFRYRARNHPESLDTSDVRHWNDYRGELWSGKQKVNQYLDRVRSMKQVETDASRLQLLGELESWAEQILSSLQ
jgi:exodeoxyribonuclease-1